MPKGRGAADAIIVILPGLNEFAEKYFELSQDFLAQNYGVWVIDWRGQGLSGRYLPNPLKRHSEGFNHDISDFHHLIMGYVKLSGGGQEEEGGKRREMEKEGRAAPPLIMLGHSMGGNIGLRYLAQHPDIFKAAGFSAPMVGIQAVQSWPESLARALSAALNLCIGTLFTSFHGHKTTRQNKIFNGNPLSSDPKRFALTSSWMAFNKDLRIGDVTFGWVYHALRSCLALQDPKTLNTIHTHCLIATAEHETIVSNHATQNTVSLLLSAELIEIQGAQHEILMESDTIRDRFLSQFFTFIDKNIT